MIDSFKIGDIVEYIDDWKPNRKWYLLDIRDDLCDIVIIRNGKYTTIKSFGAFEEEYLNASIINLPISKIKKEES